MTSGPVEQSGQDEASSQSIGTNSEASLTTATRDPATRRSKLLEIARERSRDASADVSAPPVEVVEPADAPLTTDDVQQRELLEFLRGLMERDRKRRRQLELIKGFLENPVEFGLQTDVVPTSSTSEEIDRRKKDLEYRVRLLEVMLDIYKGELELLGMTQGNSEQ